MSKHDPAIVEGCKSVLRIYFRKHPMARPTDLEEAVLGGNPDVWASCGCPNWFDSPFSEALSVLVALGEVHESRDRLGYCYSRVIKVPS